MNATTTNRNSVVNQLQMIANKISELAERSEVLLKTPSTGSVTEGLIAIGLCKQAGEQVRAACQNLGLTAESLPSLAGSPAEVDNRLAQSIDGVIEVVQRMINVPRNAIAPGIEAFVGEMLVIAAITASRAEQHVKEGERLSKVA